MARKVRSIRTPELKAKVALAAVQGQQTTAQLSNFTAMVSGQAGTTWDRVQTQLGGHVHHSLDITYAWEFMRCGHCGHPITGERIRKKMKSVDRFYTDYRWTYYTKAGHPRIRVREADIESQVMGIFEKMKVEDEKVRDWFRLVLASQTRDAQADSLAQRSELQRQETLLVQQQHRLLNLRLADDID
jgi:site-specific DNA recombinase